MGVNETSIIITQYAVNVLTQDGLEPQVAFVSATSDAVCVITGLQVSTTYEIKVDVVIDTEGQGEQMYDIGSIPFDFNTKSE